MIQSKTILLDDNIELHIDPVGDQIELAVKLRTRFGVSELSRIRLTKSQRIGMATHLLGDDLTEVSKGLAVEMMKEAA